MITFHGKQIGPFTIHGEIKSAFHFSRKNSTFGQELTQPGAHYPSAPCSVSCAKQKEIREEHATQ